MKDINRIKVILRANNMVVTLEVFVATIDMYRDAL